MFYEALRISIGLSEKNYDILNLLGFGVFLNIKENKIRLSRYINKEYDNILLSEDFNYINASFGNLQMCQVLLNSSSYTDEESIDNTIFNISNNYSWKLYMNSDIKNGNYAFCSENDCVEDPDYIIPIHISNDQINKDCLPKNSFEVQISSFAFEINILNNEKENKMFYEDCIPEMNKLISSNCAHFYKFNEDIALYKGVVISKKYIEVPLFESYNKVNEIIVSTQFGKLPIYYSDDISNEVKVGDIIECSLYITVDAVLHFSDITNDLNLINNYQLLKLSCEKHNFKIMYDILADDVEYHSNNYNLKGKDMVYNTLQEIADNQCNLYCQMIPSIVTQENEDGNFKVDDFVLMFTQDVDGKAIGEFKIYLNDDKKINKILFCTDMKIKFRNIDGFKID